jgi:hypothetical protein
MKIDRRAALGLGLAGVGLAAAGAAAAAQEPTAGTLSVAHDDGRYAGAIADIRAMPNSMWRPTPCRA